MNLAAATCVSLYIANLLVFISFHLLDRTNRVTRHAVSDYALGQTAWLFKLYGAIGTTAALLMAWLFYSASPIRFAADLPVYLVAMAATRVGLTVYPTDRADTPRTRVGRIHFLCAALSFASITILILRATSTFAAHPHLPVLHPLWLILAWIAVTTFAGLTATRFGFLAGAFGLLERIFILANAIWLLLAAIWFLET